MTDSIARGLHWNKEMYVGEVAGRGELGVRVGGRGARYRTRWTEDRIYPKPSKARPH